MAVADLLEPVTAPPLVEFFVRGTPAPQGSKRAIVNRHTGKPTVVESSKRVRPWRADVRQAALEAWPHGPVDIAVAVTLAFTFDRPRGHHGRRGLLPSAPAHKVTAPDVDKLARSTLDALAGIVLRDDVVIVSLTATKAWAPPDGLPGCYVTVEAA